MRKPNVFVVLGGYKGEQNSDIKRIKKLFNRKDVLNSPEYWTSKTQIELYNQAQKFMEATGKDRAHLAEYLGVSKGYVSQLLNGDYDHRMSKFFELALAFGVIPQIEFIPIEQYIKEDEHLK